MSLSKSTPFWNTCFKGTKLAQMSDNTSFLQHDGTACFKKVNNCLSANIYSYLETSDGKSSNLYLNVVHFFNNMVN